MASNHSSLSIAELLDQINTIVKLLKHHFCSQIQQHLPPHTLLLSQYLTVQKLKFKVISSTFCAPKEIDMHLSLTWLRE